MLRILLCAVFLLAACGDRGEAPRAQAPEEEEHVHTHLPRRVVPEGAGAPLFNDLGDFSREVQTRNELAARYFNQGLLLAYGFNHAEALRSFQEASRQDPTCALCPWGEAYVLGPNINKPMDDADVPAAWEASRRALALAGDAPPLERALIEAMALRYAEAPVADRAPLDRAWADAMREVAKAYPDDPDVQSIFADALMNTMPWNYYVDPETPKPETREVLAALERAMAAVPDHPLALHLYIHAVEPSSAPERAEAAADTLGPLSPGAGHLVHMPSHIYLRVGRYHDASAANEKAAMADESYITQCRAQGFYPAAYYPHNVHFLYASSAFEGRSAVSLAAARKLSGNMTHEIVAEVPIAEEFVPMDVYALARFGRWDDLAAKEPPPSEWRYATGAWHYGRGLSAAARGDAAVARSELAALRAIAAEPALTEMVYASGATPAQLLRIGGLVLEARILGEAGRWDEAIPLLEQAVAEQDALPYTEPPPWYFPNREALGQALLEAGRPAEAEAVFARQLEYTPRNGWSLRGLTLAQAAQGKDAEAMASEQQLAEVWQRADLTLDAPVP